MFSSATIPENKYAILNLVFMNILTLKCELSVLSPDAHFLSSSNVIPKVEPLFTTPPFMLPFKTCLNIMQG